MGEPDKQGQGCQSVQSVRGGLFGLVGAALLLALSKAQGAFGTSQEPEAPPVCSAWHRGQGDSHPIDLGRMKRRYEDLKSRLSRSLLRSVQKEMERVSLKNYDVGLPTCRRSEKRSFRPEGTMPRELLGKKLWFTEIKLGTRPTIPDLVRIDPAAVVFALKADKIDALAEASKALGRPVSLAPHDLAQALGVRCGPALAVISNEGEVEIHENP